MKTQNKRRWEKPSILTLIDLAIIALLFVIFALARGFQDWLSWEVLIKSAVGVIVPIFLCMLLFHTNRNLWSYSNVLEYSKILSAYTLGYLVFYFCNILFLHVDTSGVFVALIVAVSLVLSSYLRILLRFIELRRRKNEKITTVSHPLAIIGAGNAGVNLQEELSSNPNSLYSVWGFFDDDPGKVGRSINGIPIRGTIDDLPNILNDSAVFDVVLAIPSLDLSRRREIIRMCSKMQCRLKIMPDTIRTMEMSEAGLASSMRAVRVEDLLGRTTVILGKEELGAFVTGKTVMVTGGGGSIGSELCRQIAAADVGKLIIFDINENDSYMLFRELRHLLGERVNAVVEIGSIADERRVREIFEKYHPQIIFHAAAHKHVPLMESCPCEAVRNNVFGSYQMFTCAKEYGCEKFVMISTDKAINPTNVMGATKRYCEMMMHAVSSQPDCHTRFVSVRFGNVLGSHGSVIPLFEMQIAHGGPVTVTDKRMTRYFMTIPEAAGLVIKAASMAESSETFILDMGQPCKVIELAENLVRLSGFEPYSEIPIIETGLRPGEKLYEELLVNDKDHTATAASKIFVEKNSEDFDMETLRLQLARFAESIAATDESKTRALLHEFIPTFRTPEEVNSAVAETSEEEQANPALDENA